MRITSDVDAMNDESSTDQLKRLQQYCAKAERCTDDVVRKMLDWGLPEDVFESLLHQLRTDKFLDDNRYLESYVREKWNLDHWGKLKIKNALILKAFSESVIDAALQKIDESAYLDVLSQLLQSKRQSLSQTDNDSMAAKLSSYASSKGFEEEYILEWLQAHHIVD